MANGLHSMGLFVRSMEHGAETDFHAPPGACVSMSSEKYKSVTSLTNPMYKRGSPVYNAQKIFSFPVYCFH